MEAATVEPTIVDWYRELNALEIVLSSNYALGDAFQEHLQAVDLSEGLNLQPGGPGNPPSLWQAFGEVVPDDEDARPADKVRQAREHLLIARLLRAITPELIDESASYFEGLAAENLADVDLKELSGGNVDLLLREENDR